MDSGRKHMFGTKIRPLYLLYPMDILMASSSFVGFYLGHSSRKELAIEKVIIMMVTLDLIQ